MCGGGGQIGQILGPCGGGGQMTPLTAPLPDYGPEYSKLKVVHNTNHLVSFSADENKLIPRKRGKYLNWLIPINRDNSTKKPHRR